MSIFGEWLDIETAPRDGTHILTWNETPTYDEDLGKTTLEEGVSVAYWLFGDWMEYPANPRFVQGQKHTHWMPLPGKPRATIPADLGKAIRNVRGGDAPKPKRGFA